MSLCYGENFEYRVRGAFLGKLGKVPAYWLAFLCAFIACIVYNVAIISLRVAFFPQDADVFAELEKDPLIKARFEEEAASELQQGWNRGKPGAEEEIQALLDQPRFLEEGNASLKSFSLSIKGRTSDDDGETAESERRAVSGLDMLERRLSFTHTGYDDEIAQQFGAIIRKPFKRTQMSDALPT
jgi:hypothetical protein